MTVYNAREIDWSLYTRAVREDQSISGVWFRAQMEAGVSGEHIMWGPDGQVVASSGWGRMHEGCKHRVGEWVRFHGDDFGWHGPRLEPWRGFILGGRGSDLLCGLTDDGREWMAHCGDLAPDRPASAESWIDCTCCPHPRRYSQTQHRYQQPQQLSLLDLLEVA